MADELTEKLAGLIEIAGPIRPGDTLVLRLPGNMTRTELAEALRAEFKESLPGVKMLLLGGVDQVLVYRPDPS